MGNAKLLDKGGDEEIAMEWYQKGLEAEKDMLPIHPAVSSPNKDVIEMFSRVKHIGGGSSRGPREEVTKAGGEGGGQAACAGCRLEAEGKLSRCCKCKGVAYCSRECQLADWKQHKKDCRP